MKLNQTKTLETALARGMLAAQRDGGGNPVDRAFLFLLEEGNCHAAHILGKFVKSWEAYQIRMRIAKETEEAARESVADTKIYDTLLKALGKVCAEFRQEDTPPTVNTGHLLLYLLRSRKFVASRILAGFNIPRRQVAEMVADLPADEDYYAEMNALRNMRMLHIDPKGEEKRASDGRNEGTESAFRTESGAFRALVPKGLERYGTDLTAAAAAGAVDPVVGRDAETDRLIQVLGRRKKNNPILVGEAGVGKSAIVEGLALRIVSREVPPSLYGKRVFSLDVASLVAGTKYRGEFEERIGELVEELKKNRDTLLFIDEIHTIVGAGATQGGLDAANILKPALARGELQCIGATTLDEYRESIERDGALERRFQKILVEPASKESTLQMLRRLRERYEQHHNVHYSEDALQACVELTARYMTDRCFPDKAIDVFDEAGARVRLAASREPESIVELDRALCAVGEERRSATQAMDYEAAAKARIREIALAGEMKRVRADWRREARLAPAAVTAESVREVVGSMTGIPLQRLAGNEKERLRGMYAHLSSRVVGQEAAVERVTKAVQRSRAGLNDPGKPIGVFLFVGPTGVGKTLLAKELARWLSGDRDGLVRIDMSEYAEKHNVSRLVGSPPGYVGYGEGGQLTEAVRRRPYAVLLFDEMEKAHPDVFNVLLQLFDEGHLTDGLGRKVDFRNTVIVMTSNVGSRRVAERLPAIGYGAAETESVERQQDEADYREALEDTFAPEFLNRIDDIVVFEELSSDDAKRIVDIEFARIAERAAAMGYVLTLSEEAREDLAGLGFRSRYGARSLKRLLTEYVEEPLAGMIVGEEVSAGDEVSVELVGDRVMPVRRSEGRCSRSA